jgi:hypothetical protein
MLWDFVTSDTTAKANLLLPLPGVKKTPSSATDGRVGGRVANGRKRAPAARLLGVEDEGANARQPTSPTLHELLEQLLRRPLRL